MENWITTLLACLGSGGLAWLVTLLTLKAKVRKANAEADGDILDNLEQGFKVQGEQLKNAQETLLSYQTQLTEAYEKIKFLTSELGKVQEELKQSKSERNALKTELDALMRLYHKEDGRR